MITTNKMDIHKMSDFKTPVQSLHNNDLVVNEKGKLELVEINRFNLISAEKDFNEGGKTVVYKLANKIGRVEKPEWLSSTDVIEALNIIIDCGIISGNVLYKHEAEYAIKVPPDVTYSFMGYQDGGFRVALHSERDFLDLDVYDSYHGSLVTPVITRKAKIAVLRKLKNLLLSPGIESRSISYNLMFDKNLSEYNLTFKDLGITSKFLLWLFEGSGVFGRYNLSDTIRAIRVKMIETAIRKA